MAGLRRDAYRDTPSLRDELYAGEDVVIPTLTDDEDRYVQRQLMAQGQSQSARAYQQGIDNVEASLQSAKGLARVLTGDEAAGLADLQRAERMQAEAAEFGPRVQSVEDIDGLGSGLEYARNLGLQQIPNLALAAGTGLIGGAARLGVGTLARSAGEKALARGVASSLAERTGQAAVKKAAVDTARRRIARKLPARALAREFEQGGALGGAAAGSVLQSSMAPGIVLDDDPNNTASVQERARAAAVGAVATGALEALPVAALFRRYGLTGAEQAVKGSVVSRLAQHGLRQGTSESLTEVAQTAGERAAHAYVNDNIDVIGPEAYSDYINAAAGGFVGGSLFGAPAGLRGAKSDSPAGKRYAESFRDYMSRFKRSPKPDGGAGPPAGIPPGTRINEGEPVNAPEFVRKAAETLKTVADTVKGKAPDLANKGRDILGQVQARAKDFLDQTDTNNSITELLDAEPFGGVDSDIGTRTFTRGADPITGVARAGIGPAMDLIPDGVRPGRIAAEFDVPLKTAIVGSMIEDPALRASLFDSGAMDEAAKVLEGADPTTLDDDKITAFQDALGPEGSPRRNAFARVGATFWQMKKDDREAALPPRGATRTETTRNQKAAGIVDVEAPLRDTKKVVREWKRDAGKPLAKSAPAPENSLVLTNKKGERFALPGNQIGAMLQHAREQDPTYGEGGTALKVAKLLGDFIENGYKLDQSSLKPIRLADGWHLTEQGVRQLTSPGATLVEDASKNPPGLSGDKRQAALTREYGKKDRPGKVLADEGGEIASMMGEPLGPRQGRPLGDRVVTDEKSDRRVVRARKAMAATDKARDQLDNVLKGVHGPDAVIENEDQRRDLFMQAWKKYGGIKADNLQSSAGARDTRDLLSNRLRDAAAAYKEAKDVERRALRPKQGEQTKARAPEQTRTRLLPGQTLDSGKPSPKQARIEREANAPPELDDILAERFGAKPESFEQRREQYAALRAELTAQAKGANQRVPRQALARLNEAAEAFGERTRVQAVNRLNKARKAYLAEWNKLSQPEKVELADDLGLKDVNPVALANKVKFIKKDARQPFYDRVAAAAPDGSRLMSTLEEFTNASGAYYASGLTERATKSENAARARAANPLVNPPQAPDPGPTRAPSGAERAAAKEDVAARLLGESDVNYDATSSAVGVAAEIKRVVASRSRRALIALKNRVVASTFSSEVKHKLLAQIDEQLAALRGATTAAGQADIARSKRLTKTAAHYNQSWKSLHESFASNMEMALKALRGQATKDQQRLIDVLLSTGAMKGVKFVKSRRDIPAGLLHGAHESGQATAKSIDSVVTLYFSNEPADGPSVDVTAVLLHEAVHAATTWAEQNNPAFQKAVAQVLAHAREQAAALNVDPDTFYGLAETQEFLAEAFTNPELQNLLRQMPARNTDKFASLWDEFVDAVRNLLGLTTQEVTALDEVLALGLDAARETGAKREAIFNEIFGASDTSYSPTATINTPASGSQATDYIPLLSPDNRRFLEAAFRRGDVYRQIEAALPAHRHDELASADKGPQLLINAGIALALQGKLSLKNDTKTFMGAANELWDIISRVLQLPSKTVYARKVLADIASQGAVRGAKSDVQAATLHPAALAVTRKVNATLVPVVQSFARDMDQRMRKTGVPALTQLATLISQRTGEHRADRTGSYSARKLVERNRRMNAYFKIVGKWSDEHKAAVIKALHTQTPGGHVTIKGALQDISGDVAAVRAFYADMRDYLVAAGVLDPDQALDNYFPVSVGPENVVKHKQDFIDLFSAPNIAKGARARDLQMLKKQRKKAADNGASEKHLAWFDKRREQIKAMTDAELAESWYAFASAAPGEVRVAGVTFADGEHAPGFKYENQRLMDFVYKLGTPDQIETFAKFQDQNIDRVTVRYIDRATRRGEWERMDLTDRVAALMTKAAKQGATPKQLQMAQDFVDQVMGSYGSDWHPWIKKITDNFGINLPPFEKFKALQSSLITYQNLRLLPLALMSSLIDPLGVSVREGATPRIFSAYRDALRALRDKNGSDALRAMAEDMGIIERHAVSEALIYMYGGASDPSGVNARLNAALFKYNGLEYVTKFSRLAALAAGQRFLIAHKDGSNVDSKRYLRELNLTPADVQVDAAGNLVRSAKIDAALTRFVDESVVRPTPTQRPGWHNDPHFALAAQYKGYLYSFWNTISRRIGVELANANFSVLLPVMMYLPVTMLGEMTRDLAQGDDDDRDALAYAKLSVERSGLLGPHVAALMDAGQDRSYGNSVLNSVSGPTGQQLGQAYDAANGQRSAGKTFVEALPASALFEDWFP